MKTPPTNLRSLTNAKRKPEAGDIFVFQVEQFLDRYYFGRVVATDTEIGGGHDVVLVYLYQKYSTEKTAIPTLALSDLLVPPIGTNLLPWTRGFFELVRQGANPPDEILRKHCFSDAFRGGYVDEFGNRVVRPTGPVGVFGIAGIGSIDDSVSRALGLPLKSQPAISPGKPK